jgi:citrate synthase
MGSGMADWITAEAAQARLGVKMQTLYAYTSRGMIANVAHEAMNFGEPVMASAITTIHAGRLYYRGRDAATLSETFTLEATARLLWGGGDGDPFSGLTTRPLTVSGPNGRSRAFAVLAKRAAVDPATTGRSDANLRREAASLMSDLVDAVGGQTGTGLFHDPPCPRQPSSGSLGGAVGSVRTPARGNDGAGGRLRRRSAAVLRPP